LKKNLLKKDPWQKGDIILRLSIPDLFLIFSIAKSFTCRKKELPVERHQIEMEQEKLQIKENLLHLKYDIERKARNFQQNETLIKDNLISKEEYIRSKEDLDMANQSKDLYVERQKQDSVFSLS